MERVSSSLADVLFSRTQQAIFWLMLPDPEKSYHLRGVANTTGLGVRSVQRELHRLADIGILLRLEIRSQMIFRANVEHPAYPELRALVMKTLETDDTIIRSKRTQVTHQTGRTISLRMRFLIMRRDGFKCVKCGRSPATDTRVILEVDHSEPWSGGGESSFENLQTLCKECNRGKGHL